MFSKTKNSIIIYKELIKERETEKKRKKDWTRKLKKKIWKDCRRQQCKEYHEICNPNFKCHWYHWYLFSYNGKKALLKFYSATVLSRHKTTKVIGAVIFLLIQKHYISKPNWILNLSLASSFKLSRLQFFFFFEKETLFTPPFLHQSTTLSSHLTIKIVEV